MDIATAVGKSNAATGPVRVTAVGEPVEIDEAVFLELFARAIGTAMGANLFAGRRPDGRGMMPGRKRDGQPRGLGAAIARQLHPKKVAAGVQIISAHRETAGHLARIMQDVPFYPPPIASIRVAVINALQLAAKAEAGKAGLATAPDRRAASRGLKQSRAELTHALSSMGASRKSMLARGIRRAVRPRKSTLARRGR